MPTSPLPPSEHNSYWNLPIQKLMTTLAVNSNGLDTPQALERLSQYGHGSLETHSETSPLLLFLNQLNSPIVLILLAATIISAFVQDWIDAIIILVIIFASAILSFVQEYNANNATQKLKAQVSIKAVVLRDGAEKTIPADEVVPGDIVILSAGSLIPADGVLLEAKDFFVNQAVLTGETFPVEKKPGEMAAAASLAERTNCVFMGTNVRSGSGRALIVETGGRTVFGQVARRLTLRPPETEFESGIRKLGYLLTEVMLILVVTIFAVNVLFSKPPLDSLLFSIALAVGLTPQLLPAIININLAKGSQRMAKNGVIVRRQAAIENFGSMDILCTDKTGTLTVGVVSLDHAYDASGQENALVRRYAWLNAHFQTGMANPLDEAILSSIQDEEHGVVKVDEIPYDFTRKRLSIVVQENEKHLLISKGALEKILEVCKFALIDGQAVLIDDPILQNLHALYAAWSEQGYRVLGVAQRQMDEKCAFSKADETDLTFVGFILFIDPPKTGVKETIDRLQKLGVKLKVITGDNRLVARHTAETVGLASPVILTGAEIDILRDEALWHAAERTDIFAEVDPNEKERIILALKKTGHVVGYMGDGINDAPALHSADVGISVNNAVDVAKEAADFVLLNQDLEVLEQGILEGRKTFANTLKYVFMATSANFGNMFSMAGASLLLPFLPMLPKQILLINFMTDLPEMTIANDNVDPEWIECPHRWDIHFIRRFMLVFGALSSLFDFATFAVLMGIMRANEAAFHTGWLVESVLSASLVVFAIRSRLPMQKSRPGRAMLLATCLVGLFILTLPYTPLAVPLELTPLPAEMVIILLGIVAVYVIAAEMAKRWFYRGMKNQKQTGPCNN
ncbi:MAG TPA: magnesium-translocating P-type ATPase [Anaerolineaceae bacterium]|nr:magnesium-translocating P-type ATPase [Anaerolineaceae bacterium]HPN52585.1 magnesium-translocating P-type ATPase [Anaerolineaceae bacterium]